MSARIMLPLLALGGWLACRQAPEGFSPRHLGEFGLDLTLLMPDSARVTVKDYGPMRDLTIQQDTSFSLQIFEFQTPTGDTAGEKLRQLNMARQDPFFRDVVREEDHGFIYAKQLDSTTIDYDFRYVRMLGQRELIFQTSLAGTFSLKAVERMFAAAKEAKSGQ